MRISFLIILFGLFSCTGQKITEDSTRQGQASGDSLEHASDQDNEELHDSDYGIYHHQFSVSGDMGLYSLEMSVPDKKIHIYSNSRESGFPVQSIDLSADISYEEGFYAENPDQAFHFKDYNFDGYNDFALLRMTGASNMWYDIFLFDTGVSKFTKHEGLSQLTSPEVDSVDHVISFHNNGGMGGAWYTSGVCEMKNNALVTIRMEEQTSYEDNPDMFIRTIFLNDQQRGLKVASKVKIERAEDGFEKQCLIEGDWTEFDKSSSLIFASDKDHVKRSDGRDGICE